ncbi:MAG: kelch repeat-containing protein, partial [Methanoregula sp.]|nr:kelch repeat-containing protein [Methanoregula sp.]
MIKSCFPNSNLQGNPDDPVPPIGENPLKGLDSGSEHHTVANAKGIYIDILEYFRAHPDTLFVVIAAPPLSASDHSANARAFNQWLVNDWLTGYNQTNVVVWDFYNVLTTNNGSSTTNDLNLPGGNHHRWWNNTIQHPVNLSYNTSAYSLSDSDDHPTQAGNLKATGEFLPLLNYAYNRWVGINESLVANFTANVTTGTAPLAVRFTDTSTGSPDTWNWSFGDGTFDQSQDAVHTYTTPGTYTVSLNATNALGSNTTTRTNYITVTGPPTLVANFTANVTTGVVPLPVRFTDTSTNTPTGWAWFFGDEKYTQPWTLMNASAGWLVRFDHSSVTLPDGSIVLSGGNSSPTGLMNDVWRSTDNGATWTRMTSHAEWTPRFEHSTVAMPDGSIVLSGGSATDGIKQDVWRSTNKGASWTQMTTSAEWGKRTDHSSVAMPDGSIILTGGYISSGYYKNDTWRSVNNGSSWTSVNASSGWTRRYHHSSVVLPDESIVLMGGYDSIIGRRNDTWRSVNGGATWTLMNASSGWTARYEHTSIAMPDGSILLMGGSATDGLKNDMWRSKDCGRTWSRVDESAAWKARGWQTTVALPDGSIVLMGGGYEGVNYNNDVWRLVPTGSSEQNPSHTYTAPGIYPVALQAYNTGGLNSTQKKGFINVTELSAPVANFTANVTSGITPLPIRFTDTSTNTPSGWAWFFGDETYTQPWTRVNASAGWSARRHAGTVVVPDGSIILTGGFDYSGGDTWLNDTWRSTDRGVTWTLLSTSSGWSKRAVHSSVVLQDGSIVLMGGERNYVSLNDTWRSTDGGVTWTRVNASSGWMARYYHSSVVTPDGSIVLTGGVMDGSSSSWKNDTWRST